MIKFYSYRSFPLIFHTVHFHYYVLVRDRATKSRVFLSDRDRTDVSPHKKVPPSLYV